MGAVSHGGTDARGFDKEFTRWTVPNVETLSGNKTITSVDARVQLLNPNSGNRAITLDSSLHVTGTSIYFQCTGATAGLVIKNSAGTDIATLNYQYAHCRVIYNGSGWTFVEQPLMFQVGGVQYIGLRYAGLDSGITQTSIGVGGSAFLHVNTSGYVGVGASPSSLFHVTASGNANALRVDNTTGNTSFGAAPDATFNILVQHNDSGDAGTVKLHNTNAGASAGTGLYFYNDGSGSTSGYVISWSAAASGNDLDVVASIGHLRLAAGASGKNVTLTPGANGRVTCGGTTTAFRPPVLTTTERDALTAVNGDFIFNSTTGKHEGYNGAWNACY